VLATLDQAAFARSTTNALTTALAANKVHESTLVCTNKNLGKEGGGGTGKTSDGDSNAVGLSSVVLGNSFNRDN